MTLDFPDPVGPQSAKRSAPTKSISTGSRNAVNPCSSRRSGRIDSLDLELAGLVEELVEEGEEALVVDAPRV